VHPLQTLVPFRTLGFWIDAALLGWKNEFIFPHLLFILVLPGDRCWLLTPMVGGSFSSTLNNILSILGLLLMLGSDAGKWNLRTVWSSLLISLGTLS
jgi:hypothetical protein